MDVLHEAPAAEAFIPLTAYQSQTPESFVDGPPVLYHHSPRAKLSVQSTDLLLAPVLSGLFPDSAHVNGQTQTNGDEADAEGREITIEGVDVWVTSERFFLFSPQKATGLSIPYPSISLHAVEGSSGLTAPATLYLQLLSQSPTFDDHDPDATVSLHVIPTANPTESQPPATEGQSTDPVQEIYTALSACADLHPDPMTPDDEDDGGGPNIMFEGDAVEPFTTLGDTGGHQTALPPPMPGSGGWITADNVNEFFDEQGNWRAQGLGEGAGSVRRRDDDDHAPNGLEGGEPIDAEGLTEGEETKWRRTG